MDVLSIISIVISVISLILSLFIFCRDLFLARPNIQISQMNNAARSHILKSYDGNQFINKQSDILEPQQESVVLVEIILTNKSSLPISILEYQLENTISFNSLSYKRDWYAVSKRDYSTIYFGTPKEKLQYLTPEFTLDPYTSKRGYLIFWVANTSTLDVGKHKLTIITSRKSFIKTVELKNTYESDIEYTAKKPHYISNVDELFS